MNLKKKKFYLNKTLAIFLSFRELQSGQDWKCCSEYLNQIIIDFKDKTCLLCFFFVLLKKNIKIKNEKKKNEKHKWQF